MAKQKRPRDPNQLAKLITDLSTGEITEPKPEKNAAAVALGRLGGLKGGKARAANLSPEKRKAIAKKAAASRWNKKED
ncbi:MAG: histone H1 [Bacteroidetes bacterium]|nr:histone H1 [Bacteroidota bacterium]